MRFNIELVQFNNDICIDLITNINTNFRAANDGLDPEYNIEPLYGNFTQAENLTTFQSII